MKLAVLMVLPLICTLKSKCMTSKLNKSTLTLQKVPNTKKWTFLTSKSNMADLHMKCYSCSYKNLFSPLPLCMTVNQSHIQYSSTTTANMLLQGLNTLKSNYDCVSIVSLSTTSSSFCWLTLKHCSFVFDINRLEFKFWSTWNTQWIFNFSKGFSLVSLMLHYRTKCFIAFSYAGIYNAWFKPNIYIYKFFYATKKLSTWWWFNPFFS